MRLGSCILTRLIPGAQQNGGKPGWVLKEQNKTLLVVHSRRRSWGAGSQPCHPPRHLGGAAALWAAAQGVGSWSSGLCKHQEVSGLFLLSLVGGMKAYFEYHVNYRMGRGQVPGTAIYTISLFNPLSTC